MASPATARATPARPHPPLVFVVNSSPAILALMGELFVDDGYAVRTGTCERPDIFDDIAAAPPDLLVIDLALTHPEVWPLVDRLEADAATRPIPQLFTSTMPTLLDEARARCTSPDRQRFVAKPFDLDAVLAAAHELVGPGDGKGQGSSPS